MHNRIRRLQWLALAALWIGWGAIPVSAEDKADTVRDASKDATDTDKPVDPEAERKALLEKFDANHDGSLDAAELDACRKQSNFYWQTLMRIWDANGNQVLEESELKTLRASLSKARADVEERLFKKYDKNKNGRFDAPERAQIWKDRLDARLKACLDRQAGKAVKFDENPVLRDMFLKLSDLNRNGKIDGDAEQEEYKNTLERYKTCCEARDDEEIARWLKLYDENGDHVLDEGEKQRIVEEHEARFSNDLRLQRVRSEDRELTAHREVNKAGAAPKKKEE